MTSLESHPGSPALPTHIRESIDEALARRPKGWMPRTRHRNGAQPRFANRLTLETSPYLQQHAHNPVNWFPWGEEAFEVARQTNRPVFLSIGYSTCHWCHVMEEESFEDLEIAEYLNTHFVPIKLDREERPDVDAIYMAVTQAVSGHGGWPMSVWMTADAEPFYAGTYYPPRDGVRRGSTGFLTLLRRIDELWRTRKSDLTAQARTFVKGVQEQLGAREGAAALPDTRVTDDIARLIDHLYDDRSGGIARAPKFPSNVPVRLLLRVHRRTGSARALHMATHTLEHMAAGGLYDQLGGGFHRYSTDGDWLVPHFEKMLYDQALLTLAYTEAWQVTRREDFARVVREVLDYVQREMTAPEGGFYSATDADSEGEEGLFFVWEQSEIEQALPPDTAERFIRHYGVTATGNFEGRNILHVAHPSETEWQALRQARATLLALRQTRKPPLLDDKVLASWNGLMISAFASAGRTFDEPAWTTTASRAARFVLTRMREDGRLKRSFKDGRALHPGFLDDYAFLLAGLLDLFEATCDSDWVREATSLADVLERHYADTERGGWFMTSDDHERLLVREKPTYDGAEPSGGSVATLAFLRLGALTGDARWTNAGLRALESYGATATEQPLAQTELALAIEFLAGPPLEVVVAAPGENDALHKTLRTAFAPHVVRIAGNDAALEKASDLVAAARDRLSRGTPTAWVCSDGACLLPVHEPQALLKLLAPSGV